MKNLQDRLLGWLAAPISPRTLAVLRIVFASLGLVLLLMALQDSQWLGGPVPGGPRVWMDCFSGRSQEEVRLFLGVGVFFGLTSLVGLVTPLSLLIFWLVLLNLRNHMAWAASEGGLQVVQCALLCLLWTPCGREWSMDARFGWWRKQSLWSGPIRVLQLLQIVIYLESGFYKLMGSDWWNGNALLKVTQNQNFSLVFDWVATPHPVVAGLMTLITWLVLIWELTFPLWLLWRPSRYLAFAIGIAMHALLWLFFDVGLYPPAMLALYLTYLPDRRAIQLVPPFRWKRAWVAIHAGLVLWAAWPVHLVYPDDPRLRSPVPGLAALELAAYRSRLWLLKAAPLRAWQALGDNLGLNHRYNTFAPTTPNCCVMFRLRDQHGRLLWSDVPGEGQRYSWTVVSVRGLATCSPEALPLFFQRAAAHFGSSEGLVLEEWLVELGRPCSTRVLNQSWSWLPLTGHERQQSPGIGNQQPGPARL